MPVTKKYASLKGYEWQNYDLLENYKGYIDRTNKKNSFNIASDLSVGILTAIITMNLEQDSIALPLSFGEIFSSDFYLPILKIIGLFLSIFFVLRVLKSGLSLLLSKVPIKKNRVLPSYQKELILTFWNKIISESFLCRSLIEKIEDIILHGNESDFSTLVMIYTLETIDRIDSIVSYFDELIEPQSIRNKKNNNYYKKYFYIEFDSTQQFKEKIDLQLVIEVIDLLEETLRIIDIKYAKQAKGTKTIKDFVSLEKYQLINRRKERLLKDISRIKANTTIAELNLRA